ncbi:hypothetical protein Mgra_00007167 [Meloidogyne graminicola]|uniref:B30.2/SPRY domain-containing protein n=1 Tax=Meloidogyne graminicola TaxID=189291 RepID=A0A8S9ZJN6_9BILA|nr:hypothetical protein Mgra_00007167 [Meloidogyne graminicola]
MNDLKKSLKCWNEHVVKLLTTSKIIYNFVNKTFNEMKAFLLNSINSNITMDQEQLVKRIKEEVINELKVYFDEKFQALDQKINGIIGEVSTLKSEVSYRFSLNTLIHIPLKWKIFICCENNCSTLENFIGCIKNNGFPKVDTSEEQYPLAINYHYSPIGISHNTTGTIYATNKIPFIPGKKFYFEIKLNLLNIENESQKIEIGFANDDLCVMLVLNKQGKYSSHIETDCGRVYLNDFFFGHNDVFGCLLNFPAINSADKSLSAVFTKNGNYISKAVLLGYEYTSFVPFISLKGISISSTNFGQDVENFPFVFKSFESDTTESYNDEDFRSNESIEMYTSEGSVE